MRAALKVLVLVLLAAAGYLAWLYFQWEGAAGAPDLSTAQAAAYELSARRYLMGALVLAVSGVVLWVYATRDRAHQ